MKKIISTICFWGLIIASTGAQQALSWDDYFNGHIGTRREAADLSDDSSSWMPWLKHHYPRYFQQGHDLRITQKLHESRGWHITVQHTLHGLPVLGSGLWLHVTSPSFWVWETLEPARQAPKPFAYATAWFFQEQYEPVRAIHLEDHVVGYADETGSIIYRRDLNRYAIGPDTNVQAYVFLPDPLTSGGSTYTGNFKDHGDTTNNDLQQQRFKVWLTLKTRNDSVFLEHDFLKIVHRNGGIYYSDSLLLSRNNINFEGVNALYHIQSVRARLELLGYSALANYSLLCDPQGTTAENSQFTFNGSEPILIFGTGGVDDGEDADVIIHEYHHAISESASPGTFMGWQRKALEEGFCDFFAGAYSWGINPDRYTDIFNWDGHNEFWNGRSMATTKTWPKDTLAAIYHLPGEIWSALLNDLLVSIGRYPTECLMYSTMYQLGPYMSMPQVGQLLLDADQALFAGNYSKRIIVALFNRGLYQFPVGISSFANSTPIQWINSNGFAHGNGSVQWQGISGSWKWELFGADGKMILSGSGQGDGQLSGDNLASGCYYLKLFRADGSFICATTLLRF